MEFISKWRKLQAYLCSLHSGPPLLAPQQKQSGMKADMLVEWPDRYCHNRYYRSKLYCFKLWETWRRIAWMHCSGMNGLNV